MVKQRKTLLFITTLFCSICCFTINIKAEELTEPLIAPNLIIPNLELPNINTEQLITSDTEIQDTTIQDTENLISTDNPIYTEVIDTISENNIPPLFDLDTLMLAELQLNTYLELTQPFTSNALNLPPEIIDYCKDAAQEFNVDEYLLEALIYTESHGNPNARNGKYIGLTQLYPKNFEDVMTLLNINDPWNPRDNVRICAYKLSQWAAKYDNNTNLMLECWHKGEGGAVSSHSERGSAYTNTICNNASKLELEETQRNNELLMFFIQLIQLYKNSEDILANNETTLDNTDILATNIIPLPEIIPSANLTDIIPTDNLTEILPE